jgi:DNA-binding transcriptional regulator YiaG
VNAVVCRYRDEVDREPFHFRVSGLDNIFLLSGYQWRETPHGPGISFADTDALNRALGRYLANQRRRLTGKEWLFLRIEMDLSQAQLGQLLQMSDQQVARWEKETCEISGPADILFRCLYLQHLGDEVDLRGFSERMGSKSPKDWDPAVVNGKEYWHLLRPD